MKNLQIPKGDDNENSFPVVIEAAVEVKSAKVESRREFVEAMKVVDSALNKQKYRKIKTENEKLF